MSNVSSKASSNLFSPPIGVDRVQPHDRQFSFQTVTSNPTSSTNSSTSTSTNRGLNFNLNSLRSSMQSQQNQGPSFPPYGTSGSAGSNASTNANANTSSIAGSSGARLLNAHGINTSSLFQKAKTLESRIHQHHHQANTAATNTHHTANQSVHQNTNPTLIQHNKITIARHGNIQQTLDSIRLQTIENILHKQKTNMKEDIQRKIEKRIVQDWKETKRRLIHDTVILDDTGRRITIVNDDCHEVREGEEKKNSEDDTLTLLASSSSPPSSVFPSSSSSSSSSMSMATKTFSISNNPREVQEFHQFANYHYANIFNTSEYKSTLSQATSYSNPQQLIILNSLVNMCKELSASDGIYNPYLNGCKLIKTLSTTMSDIKSSSGSAGTGTGTGSGGMMISHPSAASSSLASVKDRTISSLLFLSNQFREYIITKVKNSTTSSSSSPSSSSATTFTDGNGFTSYITKFVDLESKSIGQNSSQRDLLFKCMYYSLRCGDVQSALELYANSHVASGGNANYGNVNCMKNVLEFLVRVMNVEQNAMANTTGRSSSSNSISNTTSTKEKRAIGLFQGLNNLPPNYIAEMKDLYQHVLLNVHSSSNQNHILGSTTSSNNDVGEYEIALIGMFAFCCGDESSNNGGGSNVATSTIEDYIFIKLWNAMAPECNMLDALVSLGENIKSYGYEYFDGTANDPGSTGGSIAKSFGWAYAMPLLLAQCYKSGIVHLAQSGSGFGLCMAVHLSIVLNKYDRIALVDLVDEKNVHMTKESLIRDEHNMVLSTLLVSYAKALQMSSPPVALEYIVQIPDGTSSQITMKNGNKLSQNADKQIVNLLLETKAFDILAGQISDDGSRLATGALDMYFTTSGISDLLASAANICMAEGKTAMTVELLSLAGHHSTVLSILNRQLASLVVVGGSQDEMTMNSGGIEKQQQRMIWRDAALRFHSFYLSQGHSFVIQKLESEGQLSLGMDFQMLLNLMVFFDRCNEQNWKAAWELVSDLDLLPTSEDNINTAIESFHKLSDEIKQIFHHIILKSMNCLTNLHAMYKSSLSGGSSTNVQIASDPRLVQLRQSAKSLVTFAGFVRLKHADGVRAQIGKMEAYMI